MKIDDFIDYFSETYVELFDYVDFGPSANTFLKASGVKNEPTPLELARELSQHGPRILGHSGLEMYMNLLRRIAVHFDLIVATAPNLVETLKKTSWCVGFQRRDPVSGPTNSEKPHEVDVPLEYILARASDIAIIDDTVLQQIFNPLS
jgi:hypothetical protein